MTDKGSFPGRMLNAMHAVIMVAVVVLLALVAYNYTLSGKLSLMSVVVAMVLVVVVLTQRAFIFKKGDGGR